MSIARTLYQKAPRPAQSLWNLVARFVPFSFRSRQFKWVKNSYTKFGDDQRKYIFMSIARFCQINRPIPGYYFEFGCHEANTMRMAYDASRYLFDWTYVAFDSFEGLPEIKKIDEQEIWEKGKLKTEEEKFRQIVLGHGMPPEKLRLVKGFYDDSLTEELKRTLLPQKAAVVYVDCDLYESTVPVLRFIKDFLQRGTILVFDDWNCFHGDPEKGERRAFREFCEQNPELLFESFVETNEAKSFIYLGQKNAGRLSS